MTDKPTDKLRQKHILLDRGKCRLTSLIALYLVTHKNWYIGNLYSSRCGLVGTFVWINSDHFVHWGGEGMGAPACLFRTCLLYQMWHANCDNPPVKGSAPIILWYNDALL